MRCFPMPAARVLTSLACLRARMHFEEGRNKEAVDDIVEALTLGRHISQGGLLIPVLFRYDIERRVSQTLARYLPRLDADMTRDLKMRLDRLPVGGSPATAMKFEEKFTMDWFAREVKASGGGDGLLAFLSRFCNSPEQGLGILRWLWWHRRRRAQMCRHDATMLRADGDHAGFAAGPI